MYATLHTDWHTSEVSVVLLVICNLSRDMTKPTKWCAPSEDSDQPGHPPSLIRVFAVRMKKAWVLTYLLRAQRRLWSEWADAQADLSLRWAHIHFVGFVMSRLILCQMIFQPTSSVNGSYRCSTYYFCLFKTYFKCFRICLPKYKLSRILRKAEGLGIRLNDCVTWKNTNYPGSWEKPKVWAYAWMTVWHEKKSWKSMKQFSCLKFHIILTI